MASKPFPRANWPLASPRKPARVSRQCGDQGNCGRRGGATAGLCRRFRPRGRRAGRRARHLLGALGRRGQGFHGAMSRIERLLQERGATTPTSARRISSRPFASPGRTAISKRSRPAPMELWSGRRAAPPDSAMIRRSCPTDTSGPWRDDLDRETRPATTRPRPVAPGTRLRQAGGDLSWLAPNAITRSGPPSASTCTGRSACRSARIAISTATSATRPSTRNDLRARLRAKLKQQRRARLIEPSRRSFSAAARRR